MPVTSLDAKSVELNTATVSEIADRENMTYETALRQIRINKGGRLFIGVDEREQLLQLIKVSWNKNKGER